MCEEEDAKESVLRKPTFAVVALLDRALNPREEPKLVGVRSGSSVFSLSSLSFSFRRCTRSRMSQYLDSSRLIVELEVSPEEDGVCFLRLAGTGVRVEDVTCTVGVLSLSSVVSRLGDESNRLPKVRNRGL